MSPAASAYLSPAVNDAPRMRSGGADWLSLALMDARTRTLGWLSVFEGLQLSGRLERLDPPLWVIGHAAWFQEYWIARHLQRARGAAADPSALRLPSMSRAADGWYSPQSVRRADRWTTALPEGATLRDYLQATLDATLELLDKAEATDAGLHVYRQALHHEDLAGETLAVLAQALDLSPERQAQAEALGLTAPWRTLMRRPPVGLPGQRIVIGNPSVGWAPLSEQGSLALAVPEFEIDAQPVSWAELGEFIDDGGYDDTRWWTRPGWDWLEAVARRAPRYVEQLGGGVLARRQGRLQRLPAAQAAMHVSAHEAEAWCRWAGRRLPSEAEWELAARHAPGRGFAWGEQLEWMAGTARAYPGASDPAPPACRVLRGATRQASARLAYAGARRYAPADADEWFCSFRSCAV
jgi:gamma-glutamyl hercynylcysteine S-oxide synthase